jgi:hypothetical protein
VSDGQKYPGISGVSYDDMTRLREPSQPCQDKVVHHHPLTDRSYSFRGSGTDPAREHVLSTFRVACQARCAGPPGSVSRSNFPAPPT